MVTMARDGVGAGATVAARTGAVVESVAGPSSRSIIASTP
jgi:hypothetical protein